MRSSWSSATPGTIARMAQHTTIVMDTAEDASGRRMAKALLLAEIAVQVMTVWMLADMLVPDDLTYRLRWHWRRLRMRWRWQVRIEAQVWSSLPTMWMQVQRTLVEVQDG